MKLKNAIKEQIKKYILSKHTEADLARSKDDAVLDYLSSDWEDDGFDDEFDWYDEFGRGEAEDDVVTMILDDVQKHFKIDLSPDDYSEFSEWIREEYGL